jgi:hypothetical protein
MSELRKPYRRTSIDGLRGHSSQQPAAKARMAIRTRSSGADHGRGRTLDAQSPSSTEPRLAGPIWLGDNSSVMKRVIERLYACSSLLNEVGQYAYYGRVGGCLITGNEDGVKHCAMNVLYSLQHLGYTIPPQADVGWIGEAGPGPSYLDPGSGGPENDFTNRNTTFMTWNLLHLARALKDLGGIPAYGNQRTAWDAGCRRDYENPEHR